MSLANLLILQEDIKDVEPVVHTSSGIFCNFCDKRMIYLMDNVYECVVCEQQYYHQMMIAENNKDEMQTRDATGRVHRTRTRRSDYRAVQIQKNRIELILKNDAYHDRTGNPKIPEEILDEAVRFYSSIQTMYYNLRQKKFVKRGNIKNQILAFLVFVLMKRKRLSNQRVTITNIFDLDHTGFSAGETQILEIAKLLGIDLIHDTMDEIVDLTSRYLMSLDMATGENIYTQRNIQFVLDVITRASVIKCGMHCYVYSRVSGAVFMLINELGLSFKNKVIENACDHCKKNTFERFRKIVMINYRYFEDIFDDFQEKKSDKDLRMADIRCLPHTKKYLEILIQEYPDVTEFKTFLSIASNTEESVPDDINFNIDNVLKKYNLFPRTN